MKCAAFITITTVKDGEDGKNGLGMYRTMTVLSASSSSVALSTIATKPNRDWQTGDMIMDPNGLGFAVTANTSISASTIPIGYRFTLKGSTGDAGKGIASIVEKYARSDSNTTAPTSGWDTSVPTLTPTLRYLWNYEIISYTSGSPSETAKRVIGVYGDKGDTGATGKGITSITNYYLANKLLTGVTRDTTGWSSTTIPTLNGDDKKYLWNYEDTLFTDGTHTYSTPCIIGTYGDKGDDGTSVTIKGTPEIRYASSTSNTSAPTDESAWSETATPVKGQWLWTRVKTIFTDGTTDTPQTSYSVAYIGTDGTAGSSVMIADRDAWTRTYAELKAIENKADGWTLRNAFTGKVGDILWFLCKVTDQNNAVGYMPFTVTSFSGNYVKGTNGYFIYGEKGEKGAGAISVGLSKDDFTIPADEDGNVDSTAWDGVQTNITAYQGTTALSFDTSLGSNGTYYVTMTTDIDVLRGTGITNYTWSAPSASTVFFPSAVSANVTFTVHYKDLEGNTGTIDKVLTLTKVKQIEKQDFWFAWSSSDTVFTPVNSTFYTSQASFIQYNNQFIGEISKNGSSNSAQIFFSNWEEIWNAQDPVYRYLWAKVSEDGTPFLFATAKYEIQYITSDSNTSAPDEDDPNWSYDMPNIVNANYIWIRKKVLGAESWGTPVCSNVGVKMTENMLQVKVGTDGKKSVFTVKDDSILLEAEKIIVEGTIHAQQLSTALLFASDMQISDRTVDGVTIEGKIRSKGYEKGMWETGAKTGFYMDNSGYLEATNAYFRSGQMKDLTIVGGEIKGENNPINTLMTPEDGRTCSVIPYDLTEAKHKQSEIFTWLQENSTLYTDFLTKTQITGGGDSITVNGTTYTKVARFSSSSVKHTKSVSGTAKSKSGNYLWLNFPNGFINGIKSDFGIDDIYGNLYGTQINLYAYEGTQSQYATGKYDTVYQTMLEQSTGVTMTPWGFEPTDYIETARLQYFSGQSGRPYPSLSTPGKISYDPALASIYGSSSACLMYPNSISSVASVFSGRTITFKMEVSVDMQYDTGKVWFFTLLNDSYALPKSFSSDDGYYTDSEFVATLSNGATSSSLPKHVPFKGIQDSSGNEITDGTSLTIKNLIINGSEYGEGLLSVVGGVYYFYTNTSTLITSFTKGTYYPVASYPTISFTSIQRLKGVYVTDLYPQIDNDGNYKGEGKIGSSSQPFKEVHTKALMSLYPIGSIYLTIGDENPDDLFGGQWELLPAGYALWTATSTNKNGESNTIAAGLPNIMGGYQYMGASVGAAGNLTGAYSGSNTSTYIYQTYTDVQYHYPMNISFSAASGEIHSGKYSNLIYGKSDTVQPPAYKIKAYRRDA